MIHASKSSCYEAWHQGSILSYHHAMSCSVVTLARHLILSVNNHGSMTSCISAYQAITSSYRHSSMQHHDASSNINSFSDQCCLNILELPSFKSLHNIPYRIWITHQAASQPLPLWFPWSIRIRLSVLAPSPISVIPQIWYYHPILIHPKKVRFQGNIKVACFNRKNGFALEAIKWIL